METQTRLSRHDKFISAENIIGIFSVSSDTFFFSSVLVFERNVAPNSLLYETKIEAIQILGMLNLGLHHLIAHKKNME